MHLGQVGGVEIREVHAFQPIVRVRVRTAVGERPVQRIARLDALVEADGPNVGGVPVPWPILVHVQVRQDAVRAVRRRDDHPQVGCDVEQAGAGRATGDRIIRYGRSPYSHVRVRQRHRLVHVGVLRGGLWNVTLHHVGLRRACVGLVGVGGAYGQHARTQAAQQADEQQDGDKGFQTAHVTPSFPWRTWSDHMASPAFRK